MAAIPVLDEHVLLKQSPASKVLKLSTVMLYSILGIRFVALYELQSVQVSCVQVEDPRTQTVILKLESGLDVDQLNAMLELDILSTDTSVPQDISKKRCIPF